MDLLLRFIAIANLSLRRLVSQRGMAAATLAGIITSIALVMSIPMYADAAYQRILESEFREIFPGFSTGATTPPYAFLYRYVGAWFKPASLAQIQKADTFLSGPVADDLTLPAQIFTRYLETEKLGLFTEKPTRGTAPQEPASTVSLASFYGLQNHVEIEGRLPVMNSDPAAPVEVLVSDFLAGSLGLKPGQALYVSGDLKREKFTQAVEIPVLVTGIWKVVDPKADFWFFRPVEFSLVLITDENSYVQRVLPRVNNLVNDAVWYWVMDGSRLQSRRVPEVLARINATLYNAEKLLPNLSLNVSPVDILTRYERSASSLTIYLYAFSLPLLLMALIFISLVVGMVVARQRNEVAVLRSRGASTLQVVGMALVEGALMGLLGLLLAFPVSQVVVLFFSKAISFLNFSGSAVPLPDFNENILLAGLVVVAITILAQVLPSIGSAGHTIVTYKQERGRQLHRPWWQRAWLDILLLFPAGYGLYLLAQPGGFILPGMSRPLPNDPFTNPFLLLVPALAIFAVSLVILRLLPSVMAAVAWAASKTSDVGVLMAARYLARSSGGYSAPLILLIMTLSLSTFTASLAQTLDRHLRDQTYYSVGADMSVIETGTYAGPVINLFAPQPQRQQNQETKPRWVFHPVSEYLAVPGVLGASRIEKASMTLQQTGGGGSVQYMGIDAREFGRVAFWRRDFASQPLEELVDALANSDYGVLVSSDLLSSRGLKVGDRINATSRPVDRAFELEFRIVGTFDLFPNWYPGKVPLVVGNIDYFFEQAGGPIPYEIWLKIDPAADQKKLVSGVEALYQTVINPQVAGQQLTLELQRPERQGFFGLLSVGFTTLSFLTVLGFLLYALFSFRQRFIELGMLRAIGLSTRQMLVFLTAELAFLFLIGLGAGTSLGVALSNQFIPQLQSGSSMAARIPPFQVFIDWGSVFQIYILFGLLFFAALLILAVMLVRMKIFQAIKLGEAV